MTNVLCLIQGRIDPKDRFSCRASSVAGNIFRDDNEFRDAEKALYELLRPICAAEDHDKAMIYLAFSEADYFEPLNKYEVMTLACALYASREGQDFINYSDVLRISDQMIGKPINTTLVYRSLTKLLDRRLIIDSGKELDKRTGRPSQGFTITPAGRTALRLAVLNARHLKISRNSVVA